MTSHELLAWIIAHPILAILPGYLLYEAARGLLLAANGIK